MPSGWMRGCMCMGAFVCIGKCASVWVCECVVCVWCVCVCGCVCALSILIHVYMHHLCRICACVCLCRQCECVVWMRVRVCLRAFNLNTCIYAPSMPSGWMCVQSNAPRTALSKTSSGAFLHEIKWMVAMSYKEINQIIKIYNICM